MHATNRWILPVMLAVMAGLSACQDDGGVPDPQDPPPTETTLTTFVIDLVQRQTRDDLAPVAFAEFDALPDPDTDNTAAYSMLF